MATPTSKYQILEAAARASLSRPLEAAKVVGIARPSLSVLIWRFPAFKAYRSWALLHGDEFGDGAFRVRRVTWKWPADYERALNPLKQASFMIEAEPLPTGEVLDVYLPGDKGEQVLERVTRLLLPSRSDESQLGIDGVINGLEMQGGSTRVEWWCDGPLAWREFTASVESLRQDLEAAMLANPVLQRTPLPRRR